MNFGWFQHRDFLYTEEQRDDSFGIRAQDTSDCMEFVVLEQGLSQNC